MISLKFIFKSGNFISVPMMEKDALDVVHKFASGFFKLKDIKYLSGPEGKWVLDLTEVAAAHIEASQTITPTSPWIPDNSGIRN